MNGPRRLLIGALVVLLALLIAYALIGTVLIQRRFAVDIKALAQVGLLEPRGERSARHYVATARLRAINDSTRQVRRPVENPSDFPVEPTLGL